MILWLFVVISLVLGTLFFYKRLKKGVDRIKEVTTTFVDKQRQKLRSRAVTQPHIMHEKKEERDEFYDFLEMEDE